MGMWRFILGLFFSWQKISRIISQEEVCVAAKDGGVHSRTSFISRVIFIVDLSLSRFAAKYLPNKHGWLEEILKSNNCVEIFAKM